MEEKDFVTLEVAKLLKEKGFNEECYAYYRSGIFVYAMYQDYSSINDMILDRYLPNDKIHAPTLYQAQKWLREVHKIYVYPTPYLSKDNDESSTYQLEFYKFNGVDWEYLSVYEMDKFMKYEDALNFGILKALERI